MLNKPEPQPGTPHPAIYRIRIQGQLDSQWSDWFDEMTITLEEDGNTLLTGQVIDQAALHGLLKKIRDLGLTLISICPGQPDNSDRSISKKRSTK
ncbi:MAG: hypothetical protein ACYDH1_12430 [Anaerolineaceae bacterium]